MSPEAKARWKKTGKVLGTILTFVLAAIIIYFVWAAILAAFCFIIVGAWIYMFTGVTRYPYNRR